MSNSHNNFDDLVKHLLGDSNTDFADLLSTSARQESASMNTVSTDLVEPLVENNRNDCLTSVDPDRIGFDRLEELLMGNDPKSFISTEISPNIPMPPVTTPAKPSANKTWSLTRKQKNELKSKITRLRVGHVDADEFEKIVVQPDVWNWLTLGKCYNETSFHEENITHKEIIEIFQNAFQMQIQFSLISQLLSANVYTQETIGAMLENNSSKRFFKDFIHYIIHHLADANLPLLNNLLEQLKIHQGSSVFGELSTHLASPTLSSQKKICLAALLQQRCPARINSDHPPLNVQAEGVLTCIELESEDVNAFLLMASKIRYASKAEAETIIRSNPNMLNWIHGAPLPMVGGKDEITINPEILMKIFGHLLSVGVEYSLIHKVIDNNQLLLTAMNDINNTFIYQKIYKNLKNAILSKDNGLQIENLLGPINNHEVLIKLRTGLQKFRGVKSSIDSDIFNKVIAFIDQKLRDKVENFISKTAHKRRQEDGEVTAQLTAKQSRVSETSTTEQDEQLPKLKQDAHINKLMNITPQELEILANMVDNNENQKLEQPSSQANGLYLQQLQEKVSEYDNALKAAQSQQEFIRLKDLYKQFLFQQQQSITMFLSPHVSEALSKFYLPVLNFLQNEISKYALDFTENLLPLPVEQAPPSPPSFLLSPEDAKNFYNRFNKLLFTKNKEEFEKILNSEVNIWRWINKHWLLVRDSNRREIINNRELSNFIHQLFALKVTPSLIHVILQNNDILKRQLNEMLSRQRNVEFFHSFNDYLNAYASIDHLSYLSFILCQIEALMPLNNLKTFWQQILNNKLFVNQPEKEIVIQSLLRLLSELEHKHSGAILAQNTFFAPQSVMSIPSNFLSPNVESRIASPSLGGSSDKS